MSLSRKVALNASLLSAGRIVNAAIGVVGIGITTRYLGVGPYGALVAAVAYISIVNVLTDIGVWTIGAREMAKRPEETQRLVSALLTAGLGIAALAGAVAIGLAFLLYPGADHELQRRAIAMLMITLPLAGPAGAAAAYFIAQQRAYVGMIGAVGQSVVLLVVLILATTLDWGYSGVVLAYVLGAAAQGLLMVAFSLGKVRLLPSRDFKLTVSLVRSALPVGGSLLLNTIYWRLDLILLSLFVADTAVALYGLAYKVLDFLIVLPAYITVTLLPEFARLAAQRDHLDRIMQRAFSVMVIGAVPLLVFFVVFADQIVRLAGGAAFAGSAVLLRILMVGVAMSYLTGLFAQGLVALDRQRALLVAGLPIVFLNLAANLALIPALGNKGAAIAFVLTELVAYIVLRRVYAKAAAPPDFVAPVRTALAGCCMALAGVVLLAPGAHSASPVLVLAAGGVLRTALYAGALYALRAMPPEVHSNLIEPVWRRIRPVARATP
jgi:O-antigen/teichoic acid export membrane protein